MESLISKFIKWDVSLHMNIVVIIYTHKQLITRHVLRHITGLTLRETLPLVKATSYIPYRKVYTNVCGKLFKMIIFTRYVHKGILPRFLHDVRCLVRTVYT